MVKRGFHAIALFIVCSVISAGVIFGAERFGMVFDAEGDVEIQSNGAVIRLEKGKHLLYPIKEGDRIIVKKNGRVLIVSLKNEQGYEIPSNSIASVKEGKLKAIKGTVNVKEGYHAPAEGAGGPIGGAVVRGIKPCIKTVSPTETSIIEPGPELRWKNNCKAEVSIKILAGTEVIFNVVTAGNSIRIPEGILRYGETYRWIVDGGTPDKYAEGVFLIPKEDEVKDIREKINYYKGQKGLPQRLSYIFYLLNNNLNEHARLEVEKLQMEFPENSYIRELIQ